MLFSVLWFLPSGCAAECVVSGRLTVGSNNFVSKQHKAPPQRLMTTLHEKFRKLEQA